MARRDEIISEREELDAEREQLEGRREPERVALEARRHAAAEAAAAREAEVIGLSKRRIAEEAAATQAAQDAAKAEAEAANLAKAAEQEKAKALAEAGVDRVLFMVPSGDADEVRSAADAAAGSAARSSRPMACASVRTAALFMPASTYGCRTPCSLAAKRPGR